MMRRSGVAVAALCLSLSLPARAFVWPNVVERVERELAEGDVGERRLAAQRLRELPRAVVRRVAPAALADPDPEVRLAAAEAAAQAGIEGIGERVIPWLSDPESRVRHAAAEVLRVSPSARAVPALGRVLGDPDPAVRVAAAMALAASRLPEATVPLLGHLDDPMPEVREAVISALARLGDPRAVVPLIGKVQDQRESVRQSVARALGELGDARATAALVLALRDQEPVVRVAALEALGQIRATEAVLPIVALLRDEPASRVRSAALGALARIPSPAGLEALVEVLEVDESHDGSEVRSALVEVGERAVPRLTRCLEGQPRPQLADGCALALGEMQAASAFDVLLDALRRGVLRPAAALRAFAMLGDVRAVPAVLEHLFAADPFVRRAALDAAAELLDPKRPDGRAVDPILRAFEAARASRPEQVALVQLLGRTGSPRAAEVLGPLSRSSADVRLRLAAVEALGLLGPSGQDDRLLGALDDDSRAVRMAAAVALRRAAAGSSAEPLLERLERSAEQDRAAVALALGGALSRSRNRSIAERVARLVASSRDAQRDALVEALSQMPGTLGSEPLLRYGRTADVPTRAKIAEALASHPESRAALAELAKDSDGSVRANAVWALGAVGGAAELPVVFAAMKDVDVAVAGNAAAAAGRIAVRGNDAERVQNGLCAALTNTRSYIRANALAALRVLGARCDDGALERSLLTTDRSDAVRRAAAALVGAISPSRLDRAALDRCAAEDRDGSVAVACSGSTEVPSKTGDAVTVYVVPAGESAPAPRVPFALVLPNGLMRLGVTDRRGAVFEHAPPRGVLRLAVPAPLVR